MIRKIVSATLIAAGLLAASASVSEAAQGCGPGFHRGPYGHCRPNFGPGPGWHRGYAWRHRWHRW